MNFTKWEGKEFQPLLVCKGQIRMLKKRKKCCLTKMGEFKKKRKEKSPSQTRVQKRLFYIHYCGAWRVFPRLLMFWLHRASGLARHRVGNCCESHCTTSALYPGVQPTSHSLNIAALSIATQRGIKERGQEISHSGHASSKAPGIGLYILIKLSMVKPFGLACLMAMTNDLHYPIHQRTNVPLTCNGLLCIGEWAWGKTPWLNRPRILGTQEGQKQVGGGGSLQCNHFRTSLATWVWFKNMATGPPPHPAQPNPTRFGCSPQPGFLTTHFLPLVIQT